MMKIQNQKIQTILVKGIATLLSIMFVGTPLAYASSSLDDNYLESSIIDRFIYGEVGSTVKSIEEYLKEHSTLYIYNEIQLRAFAEYVNLGNTCENKVIKLINDIELNSNEEWIPIGRFADVNDNVAFKGTLDGQGHEIRNIKFDRESKKSSKLSNIALIGYSKGATIKNVTISNANINIKVNKKTDIKNGAYNFSNAAGLVAYSNDSSIENCKIKDSTIESSVNVGGLVGYGLNTQIKDSSVIKNEDENATPVTISGINNVGGIIGTIVGNEENDKSSIIYGNEDEAIITNVENNGIVKAKGENAGGIAGYVTKGTLIQKVKNNGTINPDEENKDKSTEVNQVENVGGIIGLAESNDAVLTINACINNGGVKGYKSVGGIVGKTGNNVVMSNCINYTVGNIESTLMNQYLENKYVVNSDKENEDKKIYGVEKLNEILKNEKGNENTTSWAGYLVGNVSESNNTTFKDNYYTIDEENTNNMYKESGINVPISRTTTSSSALNNIKFNYYEDTESFSNIPNDLINAICKLKSENNSGEDATEKSKKQKYNAIIRNTKNSNYAEFTDLTDTKLTSGFDTTNVSKYFKMSETVNDLMQYNNIYTEEYASKYPFNSDVEKSKTEINDIDASELIRRALYIDEGIRNKSKKQELYIAAVIADEIEASLKAAKLKEDQKSNKEKTELSKDEKYQYEDSYLYKVEKYLNSINLSDDKGINNNTAIKLGEAAKMQPVVQKIENNGKEEYELVTDDEGYIQFENRYLLAGFGGNNANRKEEKTHNNTNGTNVIVKSGEDYYTIVNMGKKDTDNETEGSKYYIKSLANKSNNETEEENKYEYFFNDEYNFYDVATDYNIDEKDIYSEPLLSGSVKLERDTTKPSFIIKDGKWDFSTKEEKYLLAEKIIKDDETKEEIAKYRAFLKIYLQPEGVEDLKIDESLMAEEQIKQTKKYLENLTNITGQNNYIKNTNDKIIIFVEPNFILKSNTSNMDMKKRYELILNDNLDDVKTTKCIYAYENNEGAGYIYEYEPKGSEEFEISKLTFKSNIKLTCEKDNKTYTALDKDEKLDVTTKGVKIDTKSPTTTVKVYPENKLETKRYTAGKEILIETTSSEALSTEWGKTNNPEYQVYFSESGLGRYNYDEEKGKAGYAKLIRAIVNKDGTITWTHSYQIQQGDEGKVQVKSIGGKITDLAGNEQNLDEINSIPDIKNDENSIIKEIKLYTDANCTKELEPNVTTGDNVYAKVFFDADLYSTPDHIVEMNASTAPELKLYYSSKQYVEGECVSTSQTKTTDSTKGTSAAVYKFNTSKIDKLNALYAVIENKKDENKNNINLYRGYDDIALAEPVTFGAYKFEEIQYEDEDEIYADTTSPTVKIETVEDENTIQQSETFDVKLTFSEKVEGLAKERITVNNGEIASIKTEDNKTYIVTVKNNIPDGTTGKIKIIVEYDACKDLAGISNIRNEKVISIDREKPVLESLQITNIVRNGAENTGKYSNYGDEVKIVATFSENIASIDENITGLPKLGLEFTKTGNAKGTIKDAKIVDNKIEYTYVIANGDEGILKIASFNGKVKDAANNVTDLKVIEQTGKTVLLDKTAPTSEIKYSTVDKTNKDVIAQISFDEENVTILNNEGKKEKTFTENGEFTFEFTDEAGNKGTATAKVNCIDKEAPVVNVEYAPNTRTKEDVTAKLVISDASKIVDARDENNNKLEINTKETKILDEEGKETGEVVKEIFVNYTFTKNATHKIAITDEARNVTEKEISVNYIDKEAPVASINYTENNDGSITATLQLTDAGTTTITNNDGSNTYTFTKNGEFTFEFEDDLGNKGTSTAKVSKPVIGFNEMNGGNATISTETGKAKIKAGFEVSNDTKTVEYRFIKLDEETQGNVEYKKVINISSNMNAEEEVTEGNYVLEVKATNAEGYSTIERTEKFVVTKANITLTADTTEKTDKDVKVTVNYGEVLTENRRAGIQGETQSADSMQVVVSENGIVYAEATDKFGNKVYATLKIENIDKEVKDIDEKAPEITFNYTTTNATVGTTIGATITTNEDAVISYSWDSSTWTESEGYVRSQRITKTPNKAGTYTVYVKAKDKSGNVSDINQLKFTIVNSEIEIKVPEVEFEDLTTIQKDGVKYVKISTEFTTENLNNKMNKDALLGYEVKYEKLTSDNKLRTGSEIVVNGSTKYVVIVNGDVNCDGEVDFLNDIVLINNYRIGVTKNLSDIQILAGDINGSGDIEFIPDIVAMNNYRLGRIKVL